MEKRRVLMVSCDGLGNGGVQAIMMGIVRSLSNLYHFDMLLFTSERRFYDDEFEKYGKIFRIPKYEGTCKLAEKMDPYIRDVYIYYYLCKILSREKSYDVIHCNKEYESAPLLLAAYKHHIPVRICHTHVIHNGGTSLLSIINYVRKKILNKFANVRIGCSTEACKTLYYGDFSVLNNFYDDDRFHFSPKMIGNSKLLILSQVGSVSVVKNQLFSLDVLRCILDNGCDAVLNIVGFDNDLRYKKVIIDRIDELKLENKVVLHPGDADIPSILRSSSCFIMPSLHEGFGIALIEAQAIGLHCFASSRIPRSTDCGNVEYLNIDTGANVWAERILEWHSYYTGINNYSDTSKYKKSMLCDSVKKIYNS